MLQTLCCSYTDCLPLLLATSWHLQPSSDSGNPVCHARSRSQGPQDRHDAVLGSQVPSSGMSKVLELSLLVIH